MPLYDDDPIAALATPNGVGAIAVIRISGKELSSIVPLITNKPKLLPRYATLVDLRSPVTGEILDSSLITYFKSPNSFTGEDILEISCHGGEFIPNSILSHLHDWGIRPALPGEFSYRAFMNGKLDLVQAEAISELIQSRTNLNVQINLNNLTGRLSDKIASIRKELLSLLTIIEHELDFTEDEITLTDRNKIISLLADASDSLESMSATSDYGRLLSDGIRIVLFGPPNAGKSSLYNSIVGHERAIISNIPGTTRDTIESWFNLHGIPVCLVDTAGYWASDDFLERLSMDKTIKEIQNADFILILDESDPLSVLPPSNISVAEKNIIYIKTKEDIFPEQNKKQDVFYISTVTDYGIDDLITHISTQIKSLSDNFTPSSIILATHRQRTHLINANTLLKKTLSDMLQGVDLDMISSLLHEVNDELGEIIGSITNTEIVHEIFSRFCVGK